MRILPRENVKSKRVACIVNMNSWQNNILLRPNLKDIIQNIQKVKRLHFPRLLSFNAYIDRQRYLFQINFYSHLIERFKWIRF